ncbi:Glucuronoxylan 4-O-methyltransferase 1 [Linum grandiflorum]
MTAIYTAGLMARNKDARETEVFVYDVDRTVEDRFSKAFPCEGYFMEQEEDISVNFFGIRGLSYRFFYRDGEFEEEAITEMVSLGKKKKLQRW